MHFSLTVGVKATRVILNLMTDRSLLHSPLGMGLTVSKINHFYSSNAKWVWNL